MSYPLANNQAAFDWYRVQAEFYASMTQHFLQAAGICPGMNVLDVGSGAGDVSLILSRLVGPKGRVLGIDQSAEMIAAARSRVSAAGIKNTEFLQEDVTQASFRQEFGAIVGRFVLMYFKNASAVLSGLSRCVKPGGLVVFIEPDYSGARSSEPLPLTERIERLIEEALKLSGADTKMGLKLYRTFIEAGLEPPALQLGGRLGGGPEFPGYEIAAGFVGLLWPLIEKHSLAKSDDLNVTNLKERLRKEVTESGAVVVFPSIIAAHSRVGQSI
jgi:ubiquinone/menaquinone biosynthesis C-methylase UbiE